MSPIIGLFASVLLPLASTLRIRKSHVRWHSHLPITCPPMPLNESQWESGPFWGLFIDGHAAIRGPHAFDGDHDFFRKVSSSLSRMYASELTTEGREAPTIRLLEQIHWDQFGETPEHGGGGNHPGGTGIVPQCTNLMDCDDRTSLLDHIPVEFYTSSEPCHHDLHLKSLPYPKELLEYIIGDYEQGIQDSLRSGRRRTVIKDNLMGTLGIFSRRFGLLHPFREGNGRLRNFLVQRELRRLGLACGAMMYNFNKDVFVDGHERYLGKLKEGIAVFQEAIKTRVNPWALEGAAERHKLQFPGLRGLEECYKKGHFGSGGVILRANESNPILD